MAADKAHKLYARGDLESPIAGVWMVAARCPVSENICDRVTTSFTGRPTARAAIAASATCDHGDVLQPKPPPT